MESVVIKKIEDLTKITEDTIELQFYKFDISLLPPNYLKNNKFSILVFIKTFITLDIIPKDIEELHFYDCDILDMTKFNEFSNLTNLVITNNTLDIKNITNLKKLKTLNINYSKLLNYDYLKMLPELENISIIDSKFDLNILLELYFLKTIIIDDIIYHNHFQLIQELSNKNIILLDSMGERYERH